ncbi:peptidoglycan-binding protein [Leifsonia aquatica]|uniref:peptidoglycan-binding protein n=1 Tax=Leifsonia aquatica TaxID=144185 RepID=UPI00382B3435
MNIKQNDAVQEISERTPTQQSTTTRKRALRSTVAVIAVAGCVAGGIAIVNPPGAPSSAQATAASAKKFATGTIERGTLKGAVTRQGKLTRADGPSVGDGVAGRLTEVPAIGTRLRARDVLYRVDNTPIVFFEGALPQWRSFEPGMTEGPDVEQLQANLRGWGYLAAAPDKKYGSQTVAAVKAWQKDTGLPITGSIEMGRIMFLNGESEVSDVKAKVGDRVGEGPVYLTKRTERTATINLPAGSPLATTGGAVTIDLPSGKTIDGIIRSVDAAKTSDDGKTTQLATIAIADQEALGSLTDANVAIDIISEIKEKVLSVPTIALGAANGRGFVVEVVDQGSKPHPVAVKTGMFAGDRVEVTGQIREGQKVVVPG